MIPVVEGRESLTISADQAARFGEALSIAKDYGIKVVIAGGAEAWTMADKIAAAKVPVLTGAENNIPGSFNTLGSRQENAGMLRKAGVQVALIGNGAGDEEGFNIRNLRYEAGNAVAYGMSWDDALRAITLVPAEIYGVADKVGIAQGRERGERRDLERRSVRVHIARGAGVRARQEDRCSVATGHAREAVSDASAEVQHALIYLEFKRMSAGADRFAPAVFSSQRLPWREHRKKTKAPLRVSERGLRYQSARLSR